MKKTLSIVLSMALLLMTLTACGGTAASAASSGTAAETAAANDIPGDPPEGMGGRPDGTLVSSSAVRRCLAGNDRRRAEEMLNRPLSPREEALLGGRYDE